MIAINYVKMSFPLHYVKIYYNVMLYKNVMLYIYTSKEN